MARAVNTLDSLSRLPARVAAYAEMINNFRGPSEISPEAMELFECEIAGSENGNGTRPNNYMYTLKNGRAIHTGTVIGAITYGAGSLDRGVVIGGDRQTSLGNQWAYNNNTKKVKSYGIFAVASTGLCSAIEVTHFIIADSAMRFKNEYNRDVCREEDKFLMDVTRAAGLLYSLGNTDVGAEAGHIVAGVSPENIPLIYDIDGRYIVAQTSHLMKGSGSVFAQTVLDEHAANTGTSRTKDDAIESLIHALFAGAYRDNFCSARNDNFQLVVVTPKGCKEVPEDDVIAMVEQYRKKFRGVS